MQLILLKNIERLGAVGDVVDVADGYARNWLLPKQYGVAATPENMRQLAHRKRKILAQEAETLQKIQAISKEVAKQSVTIMARATDEDHLFGSVGAREIADAFIAEDIQLEPRMVLLEDPIRELGCYTVRIRMHPEVEVSTKVWVVRADEGEKQPGEATEEAPAEDDDESTGE